MTALLPSSVLPHQSVFDMESFEGQLAYLLLRAGIPKERCLEMARERLEDAREQHTLRRQAAAHRRGR